MELKKKRQIDGVNVPMRAHALSLAHRLLMEPSQLHCF